MKRFSKKGFTITELVIVIAVIAVLAGILIPTFAGVTANAKDSAALNNAQAAFKQTLVSATDIASVADDYIYIEDGRYVAIVDGNVASDNNGKKVFNNLTDALGLFGNNYGLVEAQQDGLNAVQAAQ